MKATREPTPFQPVHLILETQEEVDALYAVFNQTIITNAIKPLDDGHSALAKFKSDRTAHWDAIIARLVGL